MVYRQAGTRTDRPVARHFWYNPSGKSDPNYQIDVPTIQITLPEPLAQFVQSKVAEKGFDCPEQYALQLLEEERRLDEYYMEKVREGLASGPPIPVTPGFWDDLADEIEWECRERKRKVAQ